MTKADTIREMVDVLAEQFHPEKVILFGSHARGEASEDSDIDLLVVTDTALPLRERVPAVRRALASYPAAMDIIVKTPEEYRRWRSVVNHIVYFADRYGRVLYER